MSIERKVTLDQNKGKIIQMLCSQCLRATDHEILNSVTNDFSIEEETNQGWFESYWTVIYEVAECRGCHDISFRRSSFDDEENSSERIYPRRLSSRKKLMNNHGLGPIPDHIYKVYEEIFQARCNDQLILCSAGLRILLEIICKKNWGNWTESTSIYR